MAESDNIPSVNEVQVVKRVTWRLMPFLIILFVVAYIDRVNVGYAALEMTKDLGFDPAVLGFGAGIFFIGYFLLEIPGTLLVERWSARKWLARIVVSWGIIAVLMGFIQNATQFYIARFLLGLAEAGFFPGVIVYLSHWFPYRYRAKTAAMFMTAVPVSSIIGAPLSGLILGVSWFGVAGWRWLFIIEGIPAVILGVVTIFYLTDRPRQAKWLASDQRDWLETELDNERSSIKKVRTFGTLEAMRDRRVVLLAVAYFCGVTSVYGLTFFLPTILKELSGFTNFQVSIVSMLPYLTGLAAMLVVGWSSDRTGERRWHTAASLAAVSVGLFFSAVSYMNGNLVMAVAMFCIAGAGIYSYLPTFWTLPSAFLTESAAAACIGLINSVGNLGGFVGPVLVGYLVARSSSFFSGIIMLSGFALVSAIIIILVAKPSPVATGREAAE